MANELKMAMVQSIIHLHSLRWSQRRIARELGIDRRTVGRYLLRQLGGPKCAFPPPGSASPAVTSESASPPVVRPSSAGRKIACEPWREIIATKLQQGLSAQRIWQDLLAEPTFTPGYDSVKCFVRRLSRARPLPFRRLECAPGDEAQADFGKGAAVTSSRAAILPCPLRSHDRFSSLFSAPIAGDPLIAQGGDPMKGYFAAAVSGRSW